MTSVKVNYSYFPEYTDIFLILNEGEVLFEVLLLEGGWWYGKKESGEFGYFPSTFVSTLEFDEKSVITNIDTIGYEHLMLITMELPQPIKNEQQSNIKNIQSSPEKTNNNNNNQGGNVSEINNNNKQTNNSKTISDTTGWLGLKDDISGKTFYFKDGEYAWKNST